MDNEKLNALYEEISKDILEYASTKLPDVDPVALSEVVAYTVNKCGQFAEFIIQQRPRSYMDILVEQAMKGELKDD